MSELADRLAVTELLYRYAELIDAGDFDGVGQLLARSTFAGTRSQSTSGADTIAKLFAMTTQALPRSRKHPAHPAPGAEPHRRGQRRA